MNGTDPNLSLCMAILALGEQATRDWLTGLYNRRFFEETLVDHVEVAKRYGRELSLVLFDLDGFKQINDSKGHNAGDTALRQFADILKTTSRAADIACRFGGDEFAVILPETSRANAVRFVERVQSMQALPTVGAGIASLPCENLAVSADRDLLARKRASRQ